MVVGLVTLGWILIIVGALMLLFEITEPGYFIGVPATVMIILGIMLLFGVDVFNTMWGVVIGVAAALAAAGFTIWIYRRLTPDAVPTTISGSSLVGRAGLVTRAVEVDSIAGKVSVGGVQWSARSESGTIPEGKKVIVKRSEGVHVVVEEVE
jgi:inner membrane protein